MTFDIEKRVALVRARRAEAGLVTSYGTACATVAERAYREARRAAGDPDAWDAETVARLERLRENHLTAARSRRRAPMTEAEALENVRAMRAETGKAARVVLLRHALGPVGNLSEAARRVYAEALEIETGEAE